MFDVDSGTGLYAILRGSLVKVVEIVEGANEDMLGGSTEIVVEESLEVQVVGYCGVLDCELGSESVLEQGDGVGQRKVSGIDLADSVCWVEGWGDEWVRVSE